MKSIGKMILFSAGFSTLAGAIAVLLSVYDYHIEEILPGEGQNDNYQKEQAPADTTGSIGAAYRPFAHGPLPITGTDVSTAFQFVPSSEDISNDGNLCGSLFPILGYKAYLPPNPCDPPEIKLGGQYCQFGRPYTNLKIYSHGLTGLVAETQGDCIEAGYDETTGAWTIACTGEASSILKADVLNSCSCGSQMSIPVEIPIAGCGGSAAGGGAGEGDQPGMSCPDGKTLYCPSDGMLCVCR